MLGGVVLAFVFTWRMALVALGTAPLMIFAAGLQTQMTAGISEQEEGLYKEANMTVSDSVVNSKTVASFGHSDLVVAAYAKSLDHIRKRAVRRANLQGFIFGLSQFLMFGVYSLLFWAGAMFVDKNGESGEDIFIALFAIMFGAWGAGQA